jgi:hypothetical protein
LNAFDLVNAICSSFKEFVARKSDKSPTNSWVLVYGTSCDAL